MKLIQENRRYIQTELFFPDLEASLQKKQAEKNLQPQSNSKDLLQSQHVSASVIYNKKTMLKRGKKNGWYARIH